MGNSNTANLSNITHLCQLSIMQAKHKLGTKEITVRQLIEAHLERIETLNPVLNAYTQVFKEYALKQAQISQARIDQGSAGILEGIPVAIKEVFCTKGFQTDCASKILQGFIPGYDATVVEKLINAGAIMVGKTNMDEFAMGSANTNSCHGDVVNPWKRKDGVPLTPGGSSGGSAAAVAGFTCMAALGTDTGGSVRQPASFTGIVGVKPTYGRCSRYGMIAFASSLDHAGVFTRTVEEAQLVLDVIAGYDSKDSTSLAPKAPPAHADFTKSVEGLRVGIPVEYQAPNMNKEIVELWRQGAKWLEEQGAIIKEISLPHTKYALPVYYVIAPAEASSNLARYDGVRYGLRAAQQGGGVNEMYSQTRAEGFGQEVKRRIMIGTYVLSAGHFDDYYNKAYKVKSLIASDFEKAFEDVDVILTPSTPSEAFAIGENEDDPVKMYLNDIFTVTANLVGIPAISVPAGYSSNNLPLGLQILGKKFDEELIFSIAKYIQDSAKFNISAIF